QPQQAAQPASANLPAPKADPKAAQALQKAIDQLDSKKVGWLQLTLAQKLTVWQQLASPGLTYQAEGDYLSGPNQCLRLNLKIRLGGLNAETTTVSDGTILWTAVTSAGQPRTVTKWSLKEIQQALSNPNMMPQLRESFYQSQCFSGIVPILENMRQQMVVTKQESLQWQGHDVLKLTAVWNAEITKELMPAGGSNTWPTLVPHECRLLLDAKTYWPYRLEWWGPVTPGGPDVLVMETEYRDPHMIKTGDKPPEQYARAFVFDPGTDKVSDATKGFLESFKPFISPQPPDSCKGTAPKK